MDVSEQLNQADRQADELAAKHQAKAKKLDDKSQAFADDRASELDRAVANAEAFVRDRKAEGREKARKARERRSS